MRTPTSAIFISFDAVAVSGITVEATKIARALARRGIECHLDLGYEIKLDKGRFNKPYDAEREIYRGVFSLVRIEGIDTIPDYNPDFIEYAHQVLVSGTVAASGAETERILAAIDRCAARLASRLVQEWERLDIGWVFVENGTLPDNIVYTKALYLAIDIYGQRHRLGKYVVWRDHDLMWNSETSATRYGLPPYRHAVKPVPSPHITYVTLNHYLKNKLEEWCGNGVEVVVKKNTYDFSRRDAHGGMKNNLRRELRIREHDVLIARTTRIIPQKRLDRDIALVHGLNRLFAAHGSERKAHLVAAGDPDEHRACHDGLRAMARELDIEGYVRFVGALQHDFMPAQHNQATVEDLYHACDLVSFLTSWDYDSYGNPIGEAISCGRCYIATSYEFYDEVYGRYGFEAPVLAISQHADGLPDEAFVRTVYDFVNDRARMREVAQRNFKIGKRVLADNVVDILGLDADPGQLDDVAWRPLGVEPRAPCHR